MTEHVLGSAVAPQQHVDITPPPVSADRRDQPKSFVFIDEQNRHKRLKVVKACDGCRRRKIKCDSATTNTWPCGSCVRLKISCIPPAPEPGDGFSYETDQTGFPYLSQTTSWDYPSTSNGTYLHRTNSMPYGPMSVSLNHADSYDFSAVGYTYNPLATSQSPVPVAPQPQAFPSYQADRVSSFPANGQQRRTDSTTSAKSEGSDQVLLEQMGNLQISGTGYAPYLVNNRVLGEQPAFVEEDVVLPDTTGHGSLVQIPGEMMPSNEQAQKYFRFFFDNIHPYIPALYPLHLYRQWEKNRYMVSPLMLEAIFACSTRMMGEPDEGARWLALAKKHEESFRDTPRLSTLQGLLLLLKARETMPTRGYYYRSWMSIVNMVAMAKDLGLHEHHEQHENGGSCGSNWHECFVKTRVWHCLYLVELIVGGPQGRSDFGVSTETVDFDCRYPQLDPSDPELKISEQLSYFMRTIRNVRESIATLMVLKKKRKDDWAFDPAFVKLNVAYDQWLVELPAHLRINYPSDGSAPRVPFHFVANLQSYWNLSLIMHHRPQLQLVTDPSSDEWRRVMAICYSAAKRLCCLQEAILHQYGLNGMLYMQRGINFTIYVVLTCTMLHLVAITHPHPEIYSGAAGYFTRHMRILELCSSSWPMPEMEAQILSLRQAFSVDINKPFELKPDFPGSPSKSSSPPTEAGSDDTINTRYVQPAQNHYGSQSPPTPPHSSQSASYPSDAAYPTPESLAVMGFDQAQYSLDHTPVQHYSDQTQQWNPSSIINNFETIMGMPGSGPAVNSVSPSQHSQLSNESYFPQQTSQQLDSRYAAYSQPPTSVPTYASQSGVSNIESISPVPVSYPQMQSQQHQPQYYQQPQQNYITPSMWHNAVVTAFGTGTKRRRNDGLVDDSSKRMR